MFYLSTHERSGLRLKLKLRFKLLVGLRDELLRVRGVGLKGDVLKDQQQGFT